MEALLIATLLGILFTMVVVILRPRATQPVILIAVRRPPAKSLGCLPLVIFVLFTLLVLLALRG